jgi:hypothetical protein
MVPDEYRFGAGRSSKSVNVTMESSGNVGWNRKLPFTAGFEWRQLQSPAGKVEVAKLQPGDLAGSQAHVHHQERHRKITAPALRSTVKGRDEPLPIAVRKRRLVVGGLPEVCDMLDGVGELGTARAAHLDKLQEPASCE